jgi:hypothetical protein
VLQFLLDEHISPTVARELSKRISGIKVIALQGWRRGELLGAEDSVLLEAAAKEELTFVSYDQKTIRPLLKQWMEAGVHHGGVVFVDEKSIRPDDFGGLVKAIGALWKQERNASWKDRIVFLKLS